MNRLTLAIATFNEEANIGDCIKSAGRISDEVVIVDGGSTDRTVEIAKSMGARVEVSENYPIFHINKQKAMDMAKYDWILQLDADERVSQKLADEIGKILSMNPKEISMYEERLKNKTLNISIHFIIFS